MYFRIVKCTVGTAYALLMVLTWKWFTGGLNWELAFGCTLVGGLWLGVTRMQMRHAFRTYFDTLSRLQVLVPLVIGVVLAGVAIIATDRLSLRTLAIVELASWGWIYWLYQRNRKKYIIQGHGPLPAGCWLNPDPSAMEPGDLILTSGRIANQFQESVGHGEVVVRQDDGKLYAFSSYMRNGVVLNDLNWLTSAWLRRGEHYIVLRLRTGLTGGQIERMSKLAQEMLQQNDDWRTKVNHRRAWLICLLPLPGSWKNWLVAHTKATGYDWFGLFIGSRANNRWTCVGACLELYERLGIKLHRYGTGLFGLGTGIFDPIMPVRFLSDPAFHLLTEQDKAEFQAQAHKR